MDDMSRVWAEECTLKPDITYLNVGTMAPTLKSAQRFLEDLHQQWMASGPGAAMGSGDANSYFDMMSWNDRARDAVAAWMHTDRRSIALTGNATDGINLVLSSIRWDKGDRILTTNEEHEALRHPLQRLVERFGVEIDIIPFPEKGGESNLVRTFQQLLQDRTRLIAFSSVSHHSGTALAVDEILLELDRGSGPWVLVDGSHAAGTQSTLLAPGIDFYVFPGHKWLFGPAGTGVLWASPRALSQTDGLLSGAPGIDQAGHRLDSRDGAWRYEYGTRDWSKAAGLTKALEFRLQWPESAIVAHYHDLRAAFVDGYELSGGTLPTDGSGPLISMKTVHAVEISQELWRSQRVYIKAGGTSLRISIPPWLTAEAASKSGYEVGSAIARFD